MFGDAHTHDRLIRELAVGVAVAGDSYHQFAEGYFLRDEGEAYANRLRQAGVPVVATRYQGIIHDFVMLNALRETNAAGAAITQATTYLGQALGASDSGPSRSAG